VLISVGTDIVSINRFNEFSKSKDNSFLTKYFSKDELEYCFSKEKVEPHLAARFAGKEAIIKALYSHNLNPVLYNQIEIINDNNGVPLAKIKIKGYEQLKISISLSHCEDKAIAFAIIYGENKNDD